MKVVYDGRLLSGRPSGVRDVAAGLAEGLMSLHRAGEIDVLVASDRPLLGLPNSVLPSRGFMHWQLPRIARRVGADLILVPRQTRPLLGATPSRALIHDVGFFARPDLYRAGLGIRTTTSIVMRDPTVLTVSDFTCLELERLGYAGEARALPIGAERAIPWRPDPANRYLLTVGIRSPHKNLPTLVDAWERAETGDIRLVICAKPGTDGGQLLRRVRESAKKASIDVVSGLSADQYDDLLSGAWAYVQPSFYEGLCVPLLNLLASGVPAIGSEAGNVGHVLRSSPYPQTFDPGDALSMAAAIERVLHDDAYRERAAVWGSTSVSVTDWAAVAKRAVSG